MKIDVDGRLLARREEKDPHRCGPKWEFTLLVTARQMWRSKARFLSIVSSTFFGVAAAAAALSVTGADDQFTYSLQFAAFACLVVGMVTIQQAVQVAAMEARQDYQLLLASGFSPSTVTRVVIGQTAVASLAGSIGGAFVGWLVALGLVPLLAGQNIGGFDTIRAEANPLAITAVVVGGVITAVIAAVKPAREAAGMQSASSMGTKTVSRRRFLTVIGLGCFVVGVIMTAFTWTTRGTADWTTVIAECSLLVIGLYAAWPALFKWAVLLLEKSLNLIPHVRKSPGWAIAFRSLTRRPTAGVSVGAAFMVGLLFLSGVTMVGNWQSNHDQIEYGVSYKADSQVRLKAGTGVGDFISEADAETWARDPDVKSVVLFAGRGVKGLTAKKGKNYDVLTYTIKGDPFTSVVEDEEASRAWNEGYAVVGSDTAEKYGLNVGSKFSIPSVKHPDEDFDYTVGAVTHESFLRSGIMVPWDDSDYRTVTSAYVTMTDAAREEMTNREFNKRLEDEHPDYYFFDREFIVKKGGLEALYSLLVYYGAGSLVITVSVFGLFTMMTLAVMQRKRELGLLSAAGMSSKQLKGSLWTEAGILSLVSGVHGVVVGSVLGILVGSKMGMTTIDPTTWVLESWLVIATVLVGVASAMPGGMVAVRAGAKTIRDE